MKKIFEVLLQILLMGCVVVTAFAAPDINGVFNESEWTIDLNTTNFSPTSEENVNSASNANEFFADGNGKVAPGTGGQTFDVEYIGLFIDSQYLYFSLQTGFNIMKEYQDGYYSAGDLALNFSDGTTATNGIEFAIELGYSSNNLIDLDLEYKDGDAYWDTRSSIPYRLVNGETLDNDSNSDLNSNGLTDIIFDKSSTDPYGPNNKYYTLEGKIDLALLSDKLSYIKTDGTGSAYDVQLLWTMSCGNDYLSKTISYTPNQTPNNPVPEPATLLLFGMGLLGAGAFGRKKSKNKFV